jgi:hypothetical protein
MDTAAKSVAIVVVHGIADQKPGQTVRELAHLLSHGGSGPPRYRQGELTEVLVPVSKLEPHVTAAPADNTVANKPSTAGNRQQPGAPGGFYKAQQQQSKVSDAANSAANAAPTATEDLGTEWNDYLLDQLQLKDADALYESTKVTLQRQADGTTVDLYEMYWADLSRLSGSGFQMLSALYQLFFHLSTWAADIVDQASISVRGGADWYLLQRLHAWLAWLMKGPTFLTQLALLLVVLFGATVSIPESQRYYVLAAIYVVAGLALTLLGVLSWLKTTTLWLRWLKVTALVAVVAGCFVAATYALADYPYVAVYFYSGVLFVGLTGFYLVERYAEVTHGVRVLGHLVVVATMGLIVWQGYKVMPYMSTHYEWTMNAALAAGEWLFATMLVLWALFYTLEIIALLLGLWLQRNAPANIQASMHTARLALVLSTGMFVVLTLVLWSIVSSVVSLAVNDIGYDPQVFGDGHWPSAASFVDYQLRGLGGFFTPLLIGSGAIGFTCLLVLAPALLEELSPSCKLSELGSSASQQWSARLGLWLGKGSALLDKAMHYLVPVGALAGACVFLAFVLNKFLSELGFDSAFVNALNTLLDPLAGEGLVVAGKWFAGGAVTLVALGSRFTETLGRLRVALDAVLDVDNYFADPPNQQAPRARIFSRYASLLRYLQERAYEHIVIVSHSQGTVISAELLRYLHVKQRLPEFVGNTAVSLITLGSPLRDLYSKRFPLLYEWMGAAPTQFATAIPSAADLGIHEWVNASRSGDYVGRALWLPMTEAAHFAVALVDGNALHNVQRAGDRTEFCLGAGAHTHYFSVDAVALALEIDRLVAGRQMQA